ncbi:MAG: protein arginine kinase [Candidatus Omnitrophota bacterium]|nr:MAG: protein arginine kinase [Candidatus Omnitrophota bacterium]
MNLNSLLAQTSEWLKGTGPDSHIVISSRIRLARNLSNFSFPHWADKKERKEVLSLVKDALFKIKYLKNGLFLEMDGLSALDKQFLLERHLVSREQTKGRDCKAVVISEREVISIMLNEEDHLRIQVFQSGFNLSDAWRLINELDKQLEQRLNYAFSPQWGYLTACPTNVGTGMRASLMLHLPALVMSKQIKDVLQTISKLGIVARGLYGEGTEASGNFFQFSNQRTLGRNEEDIIDNLERVVRQIVNYEQERRKSLLKQSREILYNQIWRAYGILKNSYFISSGETMSLLSMVRLGTDLNILRDVQLRKINELFLLTQPAHLQKIEGKKLNAYERDVKRAELIRERLR